jgi:hypothetical protein
MEVDKKEVAELVGIMLGDGSLGCYRSKNRVQYIMKTSMNSIDDIGYVNYVVNLVNKVIGIKPLARFRKNENTVDIRAFGFKMINEFDKIGLKRSPKWNKAEIPKEFLNNSLRELVLRGYFDTDGSVVITDNNGTIYPRLEMKICPSPMQKQFIDILNRLNFRFGVYEIGRGKVRIQLNGIKQLKKKWVELVGFSNPKYQNKAEHVLMLYENKDATTCVVATSGGWRFSKSAEADLPLNSSVRIRNFQRPPGASEAYEPSAPALKDRIDGHS